MWAIALSALNSLFNFVMRKVVVQFFVMFAIFIPVVGFIAYLKGSGLLPTGANATGLLGNVSSYVWFFADMGALTYGIPLCISAYCTRFIIRRIPLIG